MLTNILILFYLSKYWYCDPTFFNIKILTLSFQTLKFWVFFKLNFGILRLSFHKLEF